MAAKTTAENASKEVMQRKSLTQATIYYIVTVTRNSIITIEYAIYHDSGKIKSTASHDPRGEKAK